MKTIKLIIPEPTYDLAVKQAKAEGMDTEFYCSTFFAEQLNQIFQHPVSPKPTQKLNQVPIQVGRKLPDTIEQIYAVCRYVWQNKMEYSESVRRISFSDSAVNTYDFEAKLANPHKLVEHLCRRFPKFSAEIRVLFQAILSSNN
jgi:hypothetical protein